MSEQENVQVVREAYATFGRGDIQTLLNMYADDVEFIIPGPPDVIPYAGTRRGRDQVARFYPALNEAIEFEQFEPREFIAQGDKVVVLGQGRGRVRSTGQSFEDEWVHVVTLRGGKVTGFRVYEDTAAMVTAFTASQRAGRAT